MRRYWRWLAIAAVTAVILVGPVYLAVHGDGKPANTVFLILGALLAVLGTRISAWLKKPADEADLARAIHTELADRVARCCFDYESPWHEYGIQPAVIDSNRLRKFAPYEPIVYPALAGQIAMLPDQPLQCLLKFYFRLAAWQRDAENTADAYPDK